MKINKLIKSLLAVSLILTFVLSSVAVFASDSQTTETETVNYATVYEHNFSDSQDYNMEANGWISSYVEYNQSESGNSLKAPYMENAYLKALTYAKNLGENFKITAEVRYYTKDLNIYFNLSGTDRKNGYYISFPKTGEPTIKAVTNGTESDATTLTSTDGTNFSTVATAGCWFTAILEVKNSTQLTLKVENYDKTEAVTSKEVDLTTLFGDSASYSSGMLAFTQDNYSSYEIFSIKLETVTDKYTTIADYDFTTSLSTENLQADGFVFGENASKPANKQWLGGVGARVWALYTENLGTSYRVSGNFHYETAPTNSTNIPVKLRFNVSPIYTNGEITSFYHAYAIDIPHNSTDITLYIDGVEKEKASLTESIYAQTSQNGYFDYIFTYDNGKVTLSLSYNNTSLGKVNFDLNQIETSGLTHPNGMYAFGGSDIRYGYFYSKYLTIEKEYDYSISSFNATIGTYTDADSVAQTVAAYSGLITNTTGIDLDAPVVVAAVYDANKNMLAAEFVDTYDKSKKTTSDYVSGQIILPEGTTASTVKLFFWKDMDSIEALTDFAEANLQ